MNVTYKITGMTCVSCETKVKSSLLSLIDVTEVEVKKETNSASISMEKYISLNTLQASLGGESGKYQISLINTNETVGQVKNWFETYKPILLVFGFITGISVLVQVVSGTFDWMLWMNHFMAGFFLVFSFFKFINLKGFVKSYAMYDVIAKRWSFYGYIYAFIEFGLGVAYLLGFNSIITNFITLIIMGISITGVLKSVFNKQKINCACLGAVFNLPMSSITIIEDALMIAMSTIMLLKLL